MSSPNNIVHFPIQMRNSPRQNIDHLVGTISTMLISASDVLAEICNCPLSDTSKIELLTRTRVIFAEGLALYSVILNEADGAEDLQRRLDTLVNDLRCAYSKANEAGQSPN